MQGFALMVDIVLTPDQVAAYGLSPGKVRFLTPDREVICELVDPRSLSSATQDDCEPLSAVEVEELARCIAMKDVQFSTTAEVLKRLEAMRAS